MRVTRSADISRKWALLERAQAKSSTLQCSVLETRKRVHKALEINAGLEIDVPGDWRGRRNGTLACMIIFPYQSPPRRSQMWLWNRWLGRRTKSESDINKAHTHTHTCTCRHIQLCVSMHAKTCKHKYTGVKQGINSTTVGVLTLGYSKFHPKVKSVFRLGKVYVSALGLRPQGYAPPSVDFQGLLFRICKVKSGLHHRFSWPSETVFLNSLDISTRVWLESGKE